jgi:hypothetical protein
MAAFVEIKFPVELTVFWSEQKSHNNTHPVNNVTWEIYSNNGAVMKPGCMLPNYLTLRNL